MDAEGRPILIVIAGPNGAGKTTITENILQHEWIGDCIYINPDNIAQEEFGDWNSPDASLQAAIKADRIREEALSNRESLAFETVLSTPQKIDYIQRAKAAGYFIRLFFVATDSPVINAARIAQRVMAGGHAVPIQKVISRYSRSILNCARACSLVDRAYIYDNSIDLHEPVLLFRTVDGAVSKIYREENRWASGILSVMNEAEEIIDLRSSA